MRRVGMFLLLVLVAVVWFIWIEPTTETVTAPQADPAATSQSPRSD